MQSSKGTRLSDLALRWASAGTGQGCCDSWWKASSLTTSNLMSLGLPSHGTWATRVHWFSRHSHQKVKTISLTKHHAKSVAASVRGLKVATSGIHWVFPLRASAQRMGIKGLGRSWQQSIFRDVKAAYMSCEDFRILVQMLSCSKMQIFRSLLADVAGQVKTNAPLQWNSPVTPLQSQAPYNKHRLPNNKYET